MKQKILLLILLLLSTIYGINCQKENQSPISMHETLEEVFNTLIRKNSLSLTKDTASSAQNFDAEKTIQAHKSLDVASCGRVIGDNDTGKITKTGTFLITFNPANKKYYMLLARKTKQGEIHQHDPIARPDYFGSIIVPGDRWGKWVTMGGGYDASCTGKSSICAAQKEINDEANVPKEILKKIVFLDCKILDEKPETALFVAFLEWEEAKKLTEGKEEKQFVGLQTEKTKDLGKGTNYCQQYKCELMHLFPLDNITTSRKDLIDSSHDEIGYIKWVEVDNARQHQLLANYVVNSLEKFFFPIFMKDLEVSKYK